MNKITRVFWLILQDLRLKLVDNIDCILPSSCFQANIGTPATAGHEFYLISFTEIGRFVTIRKVVRCYYPVAWSSSNACFSWAWASALTICQICSSPRGCADWAEQDHRIGSAQIDCSSDWAKFEWIGLDPLWAGNESAKDRYWFRRPWAKHPLAAAALSWRPVGASNDLR